MNCSPVGYSVCRIIQAKILDWIAIPFSRGIFLTQELKLGLLHCRWLLYHLSLSDTYEPESYKPVSSFRKCLVTRRKKMLFLVLRQNLYMIYSLN